MNIEWINTTHPSVQYAHEHLEDPVATLTQQFEAEFHVTGGEDIGGLVVYSDNIIYDYENFCGWVRL